MVKADFACWRISLAACRSRINSEISLLTEQIRFRFLPELPWAQGWELGNVGVYVQGTVFITLPLCPSRLPHECGKSPSVKQTYKPPNPPKVFGTVC